MASKKETLTFILEQLQGLEGISHRAMMGEYLLYYQGKVVGGIYDDRLLVKATKAASALLPGAALEPPYPGGKPMVAVDEVDNGAFLQALIVAVAEELPLPKPKKAKSKK